jgi:hypothetical protein
MGRPGILEAYDNPFWKKVTQAERKSILKTVPPADFKFQIDNVRVSGGLMENMRMK